MNPDNAETTWAPFHEIGRPVEARILAFPLEWDGKQYPKGAVAVREPESSKILAVMEAEAFADGYTQAPGDKDHMSELQLRLLGVIKSCDDHLAAEGVSTAGKQIERLAPDLLMRLQRRTSSRALQLRTLANALLTILKPKPSQPQVRVVKQKSG